jgi:hypothetical protein
MRAADTRKLPENVEIVVLDSSGNLSEDVGSEELPPVVDVLLGFPR